jgi:hypothetical protein
MGEMSKPPSSAIRGKTPESSYRASMERSAGFMAISVNQPSVLDIGKAGIPDYQGDGGGLWLQVSRSGSKSWPCRVTMACKRREMGLGSLNTVSLAQARLMRFDQ